MDVIVTHHNADFDALASLVAAKKLYPNARVILPSLQERSVRDFMSMVKDVVKVEQEKNVDFTRMRRLVIVDTRFQSRIGKAGNFLNRPGLKIHCYDHHPRRREDVRSNKDVYGKSGATVTLILEIIKKRKISITPLEATIFALGIYEDTGSLTYRTTTKKDVDMVSFLFSRGADLGIIASYLNRELNSEEMHLLSAMIEATQTYCIGGIHIAVSSVVTKAQTADLAWVTHKLLEIENFSVIFTLVKIGTRIQLIARSRLSTVDVSRIVRVFGGGGHASASSATIRQKSLGEVTRNLLAELRKNIKSKLCARDIMRSPVKRLGAQLNMRQAMRMIKRCNTETMPVVDGGRLTGIISRSDLARAVAKGYGHAPIKGYMRRRVTHVRPGASIQELQNIIIEKKIGCIPVVSKGKLLGIISRTDILKGTHGNILTPARRRRKKTKIKRITTKNIKKKMKRLLSQKIYQLLECIGRVGDEKSVNIYVVGGFVRDLILGRENFDMDIVVEGNAVAYAEELARRIGSRIKVYPRFKTAKLKLQDGLSVDIATARTEFYEYPAALPVVESSSLRNDLYRRDFSINTLAVSLNRKGFGTLIDFFAAIKDIKEKRIRVLHDLSFVEDPTRILRAVRFEQRLDFSIDKHTQNLIQAAVDLEMFDRLHKFRIGDELMLLLNEPHPIKVIRRMGQLHELKFIHPRIKFSQKMVGFLEAAEEVLGWYRLSFPQKPIRQWIMYLMIILDDLTGRESKEIFNNFCLKKIAQDCILVAKGKGRKVVKILAGETKIQPSRVYELLIPLPPEVVLFLMAKSKELKTKKMFIHFLTHSNTVKLEISGHDLKRRHVTPGPHFKNVLRRTLLAKIDGRVKTKDEELNFARDIVCSSG